MLVACGTGLQKLNGYIIGAWPRGQFILVGYYQLYYQSSWASTIWLEEGASTKGFVAVGVLLHV